jgi:imidazole glycerol-phosphate synthase subunit HisH
LREVAIIDYGLCNLDSIYRAIEECDGKPEIVVNSDRLSKYSHIVIPGVGSFSDAMENINAQGFVQPLKEIASDGNTAILGICLGMQLLASSSEEGAKLTKKGAKTSGLNLIEGMVLRLKPTEKIERVPHIGWNEVFFEQECALIDGIPNGSDFYFVHSYYFDCKIDYQIATTPYADKFPSIVGKDNIFGVQFHPEKSQRLGFSILKNFLSI